MKINELHYLFLHWMTEEGLPGSTKVYQGLQGLPGSTKVYQGLPRFTRVYQGLPGSTKVYQDLPRSTRIYQGLPGCGCYETHTQTLLVRLVDYRLLCIFIDPVNKSYLEVLNLIQIRRGLYF